VSVRPVRLILPVVAAAALVAPLALATPASAASGTGTVYVLQGVDATKMALSVDGKQVAAAADAKTIVGPLHLSAGKHTLVARNPDQSSIVSSSITVKSGSSMDAIVHRRVDPTAVPVFTVYTNDLSPVTNGSGRLVVAHTAAVGPADIRVKGKVLFSNIASGEALSLTVPSGGYPVDIVPTATNGPTVFGPVTLDVKAKALTRVFAIGVAAKKSMDAIVQVLPLTSRGSGATPSKVNAGDGGQAQALIQAQDPSSLSHQGSGALGLGTGFGAALAAGGLLVLRARRRADHR
jgi:hypothetical protein